jgi:hypothetical protein
MRRRPVECGLRVEAGRSAALDNAGSGRSRMLDACALEAKLVGAAMLRADASNERNDWDRSQHNPRVEALRLDAAHVRHELQTALVHVDAAQAKGLDRRSQQRLAERGTHLGHGT